MDFVLAAWLFAGAVTVHNLEEAILLPAWSNTAGRWHAPVGVREFRFAVTLLTVLAYVAVWTTIYYGRESLAAHLLSGYALAMLLNVFVPHGLATIILRQYAPGTVTALLLNLPASILLLHQAFQEGYIHFQRFLWTGPLVVAGILVSIPLLFAVGRHLPGFKNKF